MDGTKSLEGSMIRLSAAALVIAVLLLSGCSAAPKEGTVADIISRHFDARGYRVVELEISDIRPIPLSEKTYMGTRGYRVHVRLLTLEALASADPASGVEKARRLSFENSIIDIRERAGGTGGWIVANISGISVH